MRDVISSSAKCLQTAIHAFGGIEVTLPILSQVTYPVEPVRQKFAPKNHDFNPIETPLTIKRQRLAVFFQILTLLLTNDVAHSERFAVVQGPRIIAILLQQQDVSLLTMKALDLIMGIVKIAQQIPIVSPQIAPSGSILSLLASEIEVFLFFSNKNSMMKFHSLGIAGL